MKSYVLQNANTRKGILPSSPCVKPIRDVIKLDQLIEMSVIFPYEDHHTTTCPKCNASREDTSSAVVTWYAKPSFDLVVPAYPQKANI